MSAVPPAAKVTRDMILEAAIEVARREGYGNINARTVAGELHCSTQPVMYHFGTMEELKRAAYARLDRMHTGFLMRPFEGDPLLGIGLNYIRFAVEEPQLFRFLFQSGYAAERNLREMIDSPELAPVLTAMGQGIGTDAERTREIFTTLALFVHGYASLIAGNGLEYDEKQAAVQLERVFRGAVAAAMEEER